MLRTVSAGCLGNALCKIPFLPRWAHLVMYCDPTKRSSAHQSYTIYAQSFLAYCDLRVNVSYIDTQCGQMVHGAPNSLLEKKWWLEKYVVSR